jgi:hypothetical protein
MARVKVSYDDKKLRKNTQRFDANLKRNVAAVVDRHAAITTGWLKQNAPWTDRTSAARTGIFAIANSGNNYEEIFMAYSVYYGIWLEVANDRRYAVITPAMRIMGKELMDSLQHLLDRMRYDS